ncbi:MAG: tryptophan synthase subunit alpha [Nevskiaceae bacterium]|nr:MAG: tryptophan synthase subunit alpha [Nevskiaceae bacterium]TBR74153.1 MAG: tryptophan synthase subunit alpha [Nevskiaceae bacterium]
MAATFARLQASGRKGLIPYLTAGDPTPAATVPIMHALVTAGADVLEFGVPFSDPMADGPVIQRACERALSHHTGLWDVLDMVAEFRRTDTTTPIVLMGYLNPVVICGVEAFAQRAAQAGVDGVLSVDLAVEEAADFVSTFRTAGLDSVFLLAPTSADARVTAVNEYAGGFLYYVSLKGVTGAATIDLDDVEKHVGRIRARTKLPIAVGFGIRDARSAAAVARVADAVVVGSALVAEIEAHRDDVAGLPSRLAAKLAPMRAALDSLK